MFKRPAVLWILAILIAAAPEWLSAAPTAGTIPPGLSDVINVTFNATDLFGGTYLGSIDINTNDPAAPLVQVPATLNVTGAPDITVDPLAVDFGQVFVGYPGVGSILIRNDGTDLLTVTDLTTDNPDFFVDFTNLTLPLDLDPLQSAEVEVVLQTRGAEHLREILEGLAAGGYRAEALGIEPG